MNEKKDSRPSSLSSTYQGYLDTLAKSRIVPSRPLTPDDEHEGRGRAIRKAREAGLEAARLRRLAYHRSTRPTTKPETR